MERNNITNLSAVGYFKIEMHDGYTSNINDNNITNIEEEDRR